MMELMFQVAIFMLGLIFITLTSNGDGRKRKGLNGGIAFNAVNEVSTTSR